MRILILGGGQFQGKRVAELLLEAGHDVTVFNRTSPVPGARHVRGDRADVDALRAAIRQGPFDALIDNIAYDSMDVNRLMPLLQGMVGRYILMSTFLVHGRRGGAHRREDEADLDHVGDGEYERGKRECERAVRASCPVPWTILRPVAIDGPDDPSSRRGFFIDRVLDGGGVLLPSDVDQPFQPVFRDDVARAVVAAATRNVDGTFHLADRSVYTVTEWLNLLADTAGVDRPYIVRLPYENLQQLTGFNYRLPLPGRPLVDVRTARRQLDFIPTPVAEWLPQVIAWWKSSGLQSAFWEHRPQEIAAIERVRSLIVDPPASAN